MTEIGRGRPPEQEAECEQRGRGPADLELAADDLGQWTALCRRPPPVANSEDQYQSKHQSCRGTGEQKQKVEDVVHLHRMGGRFRKTEDRTHADAPRLRPRSISPMAPASMTTVIAPAICSMEAI